MNFVVIIFSHIAYKYKRTIGLRLFAKVRTASENSNRPGIRYLTANRE